MATGWNRLEACTTSLSSLYSKQLVSSVHTITVPNNDKYKRMHLCISSVCYFSKLWKKLNISKLLQTTSVRQSVTGSYPFVSTLNFGTKKPLTVIYCMCTVGVITTAHLELKVTVIGLGLGF